MNVEISFHTPSVHITYLVVNLKEKLHNQFFQLKIENFIFRMIK